MRILLMQKVFLLHFFGKLFFQNKSKTIFIGKLLNNVVVTLEFFQCEKIYVKQKKG